MFKHIVVLAALLCSLMGCRASKASSTVVYVDATNYKQEVLAAKLPVVIDYYATWCGPCRATAPFVEKAAQVYAGKIKFVKVDVDKSKGIQGLAGVYALPTLSLFQKERKTGVFQVGGLNGIELDNFLHSGLAFLNADIEASQAPNSFLDSDALPRPLLTFDTARLAGDLDSKSGRTGIQFYGFNPGYVDLDKATKGLPEKERGLKLAQFELDHLRDLKFTILEVAADSPAFKAGVKKQDTIIEINAQSTIGMSEGDVVCFLDGPVGASVSIKVLRHSRPLTFTIVRALVDEQ